VVVVHVIVADGRRLALLRRANTGFMDGYYALPGGHQELGESVSQAAIREVEEELGIVDVRVRPVCVLPYRSGRHQGVNFVFASSEYSGSARINEPELFDELVWVDADRLPQPRADWLPDALAIFAENGKDDWYREMEWD
jgi:8-oxo-dGTP pyrophosphatase MutT (NUDIX family)